MREPKAIRQAWESIEDRIPDLKLGGILPGTLGTGYHTPRAIVRRRFPGAYSIRHKLDASGGDSDAASALDITPQGRRAEDTMILITTRLVTAARQKDPRLVGKLRDFGGTLDGRKVTAMRVEDRVFIQMDGTHLWHEHLSGFRSLADDAKAWRGIADVVAGVPLPSKDAPPKVPAGKVMIMGKLHDRLTGVDVSIINNARAKGSFSRHVHELQVMLDKAGYTKNGANNGIWSAGLQSDLDRFRREEMGLKGRDASGSIGMQSLTKLLQVTKSKLKARA